MSKNEILEKIYFNVIQGRFRAHDEGIDEGLKGQEAVSDLVTKALSDGIPAKEIVVDALTKAMGRVGSKFETGEYLIPDMLASADCVGGAMDILKPFLIKDGVESKGKFLIATVAGDLHDIGKNIVKIILKGEGYEVIDLGTNASADSIIDAAKENNVQFIGLSALLTTTMITMEKVVEMSVAAGIRDKIKILIGGAPTSHEFAMQIGADAYCSDAFKAVIFLRQNSVS
ncbi:MAG: cobalamin-binding protein [Desulfobacteraceae bacterium]|nr:corrinoid protein [Desulfobacteraceae bacterium]MBC2757927.1 cobalamin-binding protein [Desulfobacteraceae bacterium]